MKKLTEWNVYGCNGGKMVELNVDIQKKINQKGRVSISQCSKILKVDGVLFGEGVPERPNKIYAIKASRIDGRAVIQASLEFCTTDTQKRNSRALLIRPANQSNYTGLPLRTKQQKIRPVREKLIQNRSARRS
ncbi:hypothetical protein Y032_0065g3638 [Ancylostoma ceylanicum]|uniref:Uncharacterized protein n=1 Tax=Ancylostoma ceylanicum TaxID=53326 RepID=A0A016U0W3_9BILA|nr:hypothetical protein Y032_0065g3638 [Ancylostoma ceylanicum]